MKIKILFVPDTMPSHMIPLMALVKHLRKDDFECAFLLPVAYHQYVRSIGFTVVDIDRKLEEKTVPEMKAIIKFGPDVIVDDLSYTTAYSTKLAKIPRLSVVRKGLFPFELPMSGYRHTCAYVETIIGRLEALQMGDNHIWAPTHFTELFIGDINIIPSIPSVDVLPPGLDPEKYRYSGPLLLDDEDIINGPHYHLLNTSRKKQSLDAFFAANEGKKIVYFTIGFAHQSNAPVKAAVCVRSLLDKGIAVVTNIIDAMLINERYETMLFAASLLPMHKVCSKVNGMIHHCGSGAYNYQLLHQLPAIIPGTKHHDRDAIAVRLDELGAACYISPDLDEVSWHRRFDEAILALLDDQSSLFQSQKKALKKLGAELEDTQRRFCFEDVVRSVLKH